MSECLLQRKRDGATTVAFGDIFLEDLRLWREKSLAGIGMRAIFPLWKLDTRDVIAEFIDLGFQSVVCCVSDAYLDENALGRKIDREFISTLPAQVDPCGENGEFHTFAFDGPIFRERIEVTVGGKVYRAIDRPKGVLTEGFWFCDLLPA